jgi:uncharacterized protein DUF4136
MRTATTTLVAALIFTVFVAAQKPQIKTNQDPQADFAAIKTYAWLPPAPLIKNVASEDVSNPTLSQEALGPAIVAAVDRQLTARGLKQTDRETADVHVAYFAALTVGFDQSYLGEHYGYVTGWPSPIAPGLAPSTSSTVYEKGAIVIDIVQRAAKRAIWRGSMVTRVAQERTLEERIKRVNEATERVFQKFPIRPKK